MIVLITIALVGPNWMKVPTAAAAHRPALEAGNAQPTPVRSADAVCDQCHHSIVASYLQTPMANASGVASEALLPGTYMHARSGASYRIESDTEGPTLTYQVPTKQISAKEKLLYYLGSGNLGRTYLYSVDGYLLESPVAYLSALHGYAMAPGLDAVSSVPSALPMNARCMRCHMSDVQEPLAGSGNHFAGLPFLHGGITCEQCHGDTTRHVQSKGKQAAINPAALSAAARDSVCITCHLEGDTSVELPGKSVFDYKPGQDIRQYVSYFIAPARSGRSVTEIEQLSQSVCKRRSGDHMSCMSCHDPHSRPDPSNRVAFYRSKCLACHSDASFAATHHPENQDCTSCHMPKSEVRDTPHVAWTDHRILKQPQHGEPQGIPPTALVPALPGSRATSRELGLASYNLLLNGESQWAAPALSNLSDAWTKDPTDDAVEIALASIYQHQGRHKDATRLYQEAVSRQPQNVEAASNLAMLMVRQGDLASAQKIWARLFMNAQDQEALGMNLAIVECMEGKATDAQAVLSTVLQFSPASVKARAQMTAISTQGCPLR